MAVALADAMGPQGANAIAQHYLDWLKPEAGSRYVLIDVKLNSWLALSPAWQYPHEEPFFSRWLKREHAIFIFIWRQSVAGPDPQPVHLPASLALAQSHAGKAGNRKLTAPIGLPYKAVLTAPNQPDHTYSRQDNANFFPARSSLRGRITL